MLRLTFSLVLLFAWTLCEIVIIIKQNDKIYGGHVLFEVSMPMWSLCAQFSSRVQACKFINFIALNKTYKLNDVESEGINKERLDSVGNSFIAGSTFPQELAGSCKGHGCELSEVCVPTKTTYSCIPLIVQFEEKRTTKSNDHSLRTKTEKQMASTYSITANEMTSEDSTTVTAISTARVGNT
ncbi:unnamed protein product [Mytilus coruscus]|uniref:Uncharacterized protein n=1 Tax=Mytilus coruscus TaxID=42192 RepID=A0A6J8C899_MYTCO|nr:unnamed protein product [Mytilus coruscus]